MKKNKQRPRINGLPYDKMPLSYDLIIEIKKQYEASGHETQIYSVVYENCKKFAKLFIFNK